MIKRVNFGKKLAKDILLAYAFFYIKEDRFKNIDEYKHEYLLGLLKDLKSDLMWELTNRKHMEELANQSYDKILNKTAKMEDYYIFVGFNLVNLHIGKEYEEELKKVNPSFDDQLTRHCDGIHWAMTELGNLVQTLSEKQIANFIKKALIIIENLELTVMVKMQEQIEKTTGKEVMLINPMAGIIL